MSERPQGWVTSILGELLTLKYGKSLPERVRSGSGLPVFGSNGVVGFHETALTNGETLIVGRKGSIGEVHYSAGPCSPIDTTYFVDELHGMPAIFWLHALRHMRLRDLNTATAIPGLNRDDAYELKINVPPLLEQERISTKLNAVLERADACRERLDRVPALFKKFREAVLEAAVSGRLTEGWRESRGARHRRSAGDWLNQIAEERRIRGSSRKRSKDTSEPDLSYWKHDVPEGWAVASVSAFTECLDSVRVPVKREARKTTQKLYPYYGANGLVDMVDDYIFDGDLVLVTEDETFYGREKPIAYRVSGRCWVNNHAHVLQLPDAVTADYVCYCLMYYNVLPWLTGTTGRAKLTQGVLNALPIAIPVPDELPEIVRRVSELLALADGLEAKHGEAVERVEKLTPAVLAKAFRGELVPQDPNDEPASVLLERIRAKGQADPAAAPSGRRRSVHDARIR